MAQKKYQQLREKNLRAAIIIATYLKKYKVMSEKTFGDLYVNETNGRRHGSFSYLIATTKQFLKDHNIMTRKIINGIIIYVATQKCFRSKVKNMFIEYQYVSNDDLDKAIEYQKMNNGLIPLEFEGKVIANNILNLEGKIAAEYAEYYVFSIEHILFSNDKCGTSIDLKYAVLGPLRDLRIIKTK